MATATATTWATAMVARLVSNNESKCKGSKDNGNGDEGSGRQRG